eukprot:273523-Prorocentrum_minimum.AAC.2
MRSILGRECAQQVRMSGHRAHARVDATCFYEDIEANMLEGMRGGCTIALRMSSRSPVRTPLANHPPPPPLTCGTSIYVHRAEAPGGYTCGGMYTTSCSSSDGRSEFFAKIVAAGPPAPPTNTNVSHDRGGGGACGRWGPAGGHSVRPKRSTLQRGEFEVGCILEVRCGY